jgi:hypothetical protein
LYLYKNLAELVGQVQNRHHLIEMKFFLAMISLKNCSLGVKQQPPTCFKVYFEVYRSFQLKHIVKNKEGKDI